MGRTEHDSIMHSGRGVVWKDVRGRGLSELSRVRYRRLLEDHGVEGGATVVEVGWAEHPARAMARPSGRAR